MFLSLTNDAIQTYWVTSSLGIKGSESGSSETGSATTIKKIPFITKESIRPVQKMEDRIKRLVDWNVETLLRLIKKIAAHRNMHQEHDSHTAGEEFPDLAVGESKKFPVEEVKEIIALPEFKRADSSSHLVCSPDEIEIPDVVVGQLCSFVSDIAKMYNNNPFHNFEHASHVLMSTVRGNRNHAKTICWSLLCSL